MTEEPISGIASSGSEGRLSYWIWYGLIVAITFGITIFTDPTRYADLYAYVYYLDSLVHFPPSSWIYFEVFSNLYLLFCHWLTGLVMSAIILAHYGLSIIFIALMPTAFPPRRSPWTSLLFMFAVLGPLLAFVTMRATPAYFLVAIGVRHAIERRPSAWLFLVAASLFHISSLLAAIPMILLYFEKNLPSVLRSGQSRKFYLIAALGVIALGGVLPQVSGSVTSLIQSIPAISKYDVYTDSSSTPTQIGHYVFLLFITMLTFAFFSLRTERSSRLNIYVLASFALYILLFFSSSPVAAFRQAPFWLMPMILTLPWEKLGLNRITTPAFVLACSGLFVFQFYQIYL
jgi:hypothetical protein